MTASRIPWLVVLLALSGCPSGDTDEGPGGPPAEGTPSTHAGTISIQDRRLLGAPHLGHGLSVLVDMSTAPRAPDLDEEPGQLTGCKVWVYDMESDPPPRSAGDVGTLSIEGTSASLGPGCVFQDGAGYVCPTAAGQGQAALEHAATGTGEPPNTARVSISGAAFGPDDWGRYLQLRSGVGASGSFPIVSVLSATEVRVAKAPGADSASAATTYQVLAGAGPVPGTPEDEAPGDPLRNADQVHVRLTPGNDSPFQFPETTVAAPGAPFTPDTATAGLLGQIPLDGRAFRLGCAGEGGRCGPAELTIIQLQTTDAPTAGLSPYALPPAKSKQVVLTCIQPGERGFVDISAEASALLARAHAASRITRIRTALMRNGAALTKNPTPPDNTVRIVAGHQLIGFTNP
ncbi:hypothetical protein ACLESD_00115 [Pyxidicoccus sp. 3LFB2]